MIHPELLDGKDDKVMAKHFRAKFKQAFLFFLFFVFMIALGIVQSLIPIDWLGKITEIVLLGIGAAGALFFGYLAYLRFVDWRRRQHRVIQANP